MGFTGNERQVSDGLENPLAEWDACFSTVEYERHEVEGSNGGTLLVLASTNLEGTWTGLRKYRERIRQEMRRVFGREVSVQVYRRGS